MLQSIGEQPRGGDRAAVEYPGRPDQKGADAHRADGSAIANVPADHLDLRRQIGKSVRNILPGNEFETRNHQYVDVVAGRGHLQRGVTGATTRLRGETIEVTSDGS